MAFHLRPRLFHSLSVILTLALIAGVVPQGNELCWNAQNWHGVELSYEKCCVDRSAGDAACFDPLRSAWYNHEFCCHAPHPEPPLCNWAWVEESLPDHIKIFPMAVRTSACMFPWDQGEEDEKFERVSPFFAECCLPVLRRRLNSEGSEPLWIRQEVSRMLAPLQGQRWSTADMDAYQDEVTARTSIQGGLKPCRLRILQNELYHCDLNMSCDPSVDGNDCSYIKSFIHALAIINRLRPFPDLDIFVSPGERDHRPTPVPVFTRHRLRDAAGRYLLLPQEWQLRFEQMHKYRGLIDRLGVVRKWQDRRPVLRWRGTNSNHPIPCHLKAVSHQLLPWIDCVEDDKDSEDEQDFSNWFQTPRGLLVFLSQFIKGVDAKFTGMSKSMASDLWKFFEERNLTEPHSDTLEYWEEALSSKYAIDIMGNGDGDRKYLQLLTGNVILFHQNPFTSWLVGGDDDNGTAALQPFVHFVPVSFDLSDLAERTQWLRSHDEEARRIGETGRLFVSRELNYDGVLLYISRLLRQYALHHQSS